MRDSVCVSLISEKSYSKQNKTIKHTTSFFFFLIKISIFSEQSHSSSLQKKNDFNLKSDIQNRGKENKSMKAKVRETDDSNGKKPGCWGWGLQTQAETQADPWNICKRKCVAGSDSHTISYFRLLQVAERGGRAHGQRAHFLAKCLPLRK